VLEIGVRDRYRIRMKVKEKHRYRLGYRCSFKSRVIVRL
jgi:hypothetical protein